MKHYARFRRRGEDNVLTARTYTYKKTIFYKIHHSGAPAERFHKKYVINKITGCWEWCASKNSFGYGKFRVNKKLVYAHRFSYELYNGLKIPIGLIILHKCDNPKCVNPEHLSMGTHTDNAIDRAKKLKAKSRRSHVSKDR